MIRNVLFVLAIGLSIFTNAEDTLVVRSHDKTDMVWHVNYDEMAYFPTEGKTFRRIYLYYTLGCASGGCSGWDYDVLAQIMHNTGTIDSNVASLDTVSTNPLIVDTTWNVFDVLEPFEMGRLITPYGTYMDAGSNGFNNDWTHTFIYDITDYASLLKDSVLIRSKYNGWSSGFSATLDFVFIEGTPQRKVIDLKNVYTKGGGYASTEAFESNVIPEKKFKIPEGTKSAQAKVIVSGHGNNAGTNCGEFCDLDYYYKVNGNQEFTHRMWREDCGAVVVRPQGGTYLYPRANWCPGDKVHEQRFEITPFLSGDSIALDMDIEPYVNSGSGGSSHNISSTVFFYGEDNYQFDAELHTIIAPSNFSEHGNYNPSCGQVIVVIKNNAHEPLTFTKIEYGPKGGKMRHAEWEGRLEYNQLDTLFLPPPYWNGIDPGQSKFVAKLYNINHRYSDENSANDGFESTTELAPRWEPFKITFRTNGQPQENQLVITDQDGNVAFEMKDLSGNTTYNEDVNLPDGCYTLTLSDAGDDGLHWWVYAQTGQNTRTNGFLRILKQQGAGIYVNAADFGREYKRNFVVGQMNVPEGEVMESSEFSIFPNPSNGDINVLIPPLNSGTAKITVYDRLGRLLYERDTIPTDIEHWERLNLSVYKEGLYIVRVEGGDRVVSERVLIQN